MHPTNRERRLRIGVLVLLGMLVVGSTAAVAQEPAPPPRPDPRAGRNTSILIPIGGSQQLYMATKRPISSVFLTGDGVARVAPGPENKFVVISGLSAGAVGLKLTDVDGKEETYDIVVQLDTTYIKQIIRQAVPTSNVDVIAALNKTVILTGWVAKAEDVETVVKVAASVINSIGGAAPGAGGGGAQGGAAASNIVNAIRVGGVQMVQLDVTVASVNRTEARLRGFNFSISGSTVSLGSILGDLTSVGSSAAASGGGAGVSIGGVSATPTASANVVFGVIPAKFQSLLQALKNDQLAKVLAEPKVVAMSGRRATFLSGGQQAIQGPSSGLGGTSVVLHDVGTNLECTPVVLGNGRIYLEVDSGYTAVNNARGIILNGGLTPGFDQQAIKTAVEMEPGQTFAIGGLIQTTVQASATRIPVLGSLPYIGTAFSQVSHTTTEDELVILITPHLVDSQDCAQASKRLPGRETRDPDDYELFLEGLLEAPRGQRKVFEDGKYKAAYKNDPSIRQFPCADPQPRQPRQGIGGANGNCGPNGNCGSTGGMPGQLPVDLNPKTDPGMIPPSKGDPNQRIVPDRESLPPPTPASDAPPVKIGPDAPPRDKGGPMAPIIPPAPRDGDEPQKN